MSGSNRTDKGLIVRFASNEVNEVEGFCVIRTSGIPGIAQVRLYEETIVHVKESHGNQFPVEMPVMVEAVATAIQVPSSTLPAYGRSLELIHRETTNARGYPLRVFVKPIADTTSGRVSTFFFAPEDDADDSV